VRIAEDRSVRPFVVDVADTELDDLGRRLASTRVVSRDRER
jgi:hypothetical protein